MKKLITFLILIFIGLNLVAQRVHDFDPVKRGEFNILDYGATSGGTVEDATAIQIAINAAYALTKAYPDEAYRYGGTVKIPAGIWYITKPVILRSYISIEIDKGAIFNFPAGYTNTMWANDSTDYLVECYVDGGRWYKDTPTYTFARLFSSQNANYIMACSFKNMWIENADIVFDIRTTLGGAGDGWVNANTFSDIFAWCPNRFLRTLKSPTSSGMDGNIYTNIIVQASGTTIAAIDTLNGSLNTFNNLILYDFTGGMYDVIIASGANYNSISGTQIRSANTVDLGGHNRITTSGGLLLTDTRGLDWGDLYVYRKAAGLLKIEDALELFPSVNPPGGATEGAIYADTDHHLYYYNGTTWIQLDN